MHTAPTHHSADSSSSRSGPVRIPKVRIHLGHLLSRIAGALVALCLWGAILLPIYMVLTS
jgi:hypothetical protein